MKIEETEQLTTDFDWFEFDDYGIMTMIERISQ